MVLCFNRERDIDGFTFKFHVSTDELGLDGLVLTPEAANLDDLDYIEAAKTGIELFVSLRKLWWVVMWSQSPGVWGSNTVEGLERYERSRKWALSQTDWELSPRERENLIKMGDIIIGRRDDIIRLEERRQVKEAKKQRQKATAAGYVYLIESAHGVYKIGLTRNPENRMATFGVKLPFPVEYCCLIQTDDMRGLEARLHERYTTKRVNGEWFNLDADDVEYIKSLAQVNS